MADGPHYEGPKQRTLTTLKVHDIVEWRDHNFGHHHRWRIVGIHIGAIGYESVYAVENVSHKPAWDEVDLIVMHIPECLMRQCRIAGHSNPYGDTP